MGNLMSDGVTTFLRAVVGVNKNDRVPRKRDEGAVKSSFNRVKSHRQLSISEPGVNPTDRELGQFHDGDWQR
jgi:hypothetical protein